MSNPLKRIIFQFLSFSRSDRNAIIILATLIVLVLIVNIIVRNLKPRPAISQEVYQQILADWNSQTEVEKEEVRSLFHFNPNKISVTELDSLLLSDFVKRNIVNFRSAGGKFYSPKDIRKIYGMNDSIFYKIKPYLIFDGLDTKQTKNTKLKLEIRGENFDPNNVSANKLKEIGFNNYQIGNLIKYRNKGGIFKRPADLKKIYGIDLEFFNMISKFVVIVEEKKDVVSSKKKINLIELNSTDSTELVKLRGIGPVFATRILKYRDLLGGYYEKEQLLEVYGFPEETYTRIKDQITVDTTLVKKIRIDFAEFSDLLRHPYLNKVQVKTLIELRTKNGSFSKMSDSQWFEVVSDNGIEKIQAYIERE